MLKIGLTGGMGSGKSTVAKVFELLGVPVFYADDASKRLYHTNLELRSSLKKEFGDDIYSGDELNRKKLAEIVFSDSGRLEKLNQLVHPLTIREASEWISKQTTPYIIKEAALLFESGSARNLDLVIGISSPLELRIQRIMERDQSERTEIIKRMDKQMDEEEKMKLCDFVILNDEKNLIIPQVISLHQKFMTMNDK